MADVVKPDLPNPGDRLADRYTIIQRVSLGGFGAVYRALQDNLGRDIALKVLLPDVVSNNADYVEQFRQEALLTSQLRHPNTITIFDYGQTETGLLFLVMEWLDGKTLTEVLKNEGALSYDRCLHISQQILKSLSEAHERGMVHRDLKPSNLMLCVQYGEQDFVKVLDFGLVKNLSDETLSIRGKAVEAPHFTAKRRAPGTPHYMAPEQAMGKGTTTSADVYAFGLILYEMLTGKRAFDGTDKMEVLLKQVRQPCPPLPDELADTFLGKVVARCVEKDPLKRPQNASALLRDYQLNEETRGLEINNADFEAQARWKSLAEPRVVSEVSSSLKEVFVGRKDEIEEFSSVVKRCQNEGRGAAIVVTGATGIGKTTLLNKFSDIFLQETSGFRIASAFLPQNYLSYSAIRHAFRKFLGVQSDDASVAQNEIKSALSKNYGITDSYLVTFLTHFIVGKYGQASEEREQTELRIEEFLESLSRIKPVMFSLENIHWADTESLNLFCKLAASLGNKPRSLFVMATFRHQKLATNRELQMFLERLNRLEHTMYREVQLAWLNKKDCAAIIENAVKMQRPMANQCMQLSKGNPLFLNLVLRYIVDEKQALGSDDAQKLVIPNSIERLSLKRIDQIVRKYNQPEYREILRRAALMGETFSLSGVEALLRRDGQYGLLDYTSRALEVWRREGILRRQWDADMSFEFIHPHIVEFFNIDSSPELHLNVARTKEALSETDLFIDLEDVARHFKLAGDKKNALRYLDYAANAAIQNTNMLKARKLYEEMLPLFEPNESLERQKNIYYQLGELTLRLSEYGPSKDYFQKTILLAQNCEDHPLEALAYCGIAELSLAQNQLEEASANYTRAKNALPGDNPTVQSKLVLGMGKLSKLKADWQAAMACFQKAYDYSSKVGNFDFMGHALYELGVIYLSLGDARQAHECFLTAQKHYQTMNNAADEAKVLLALSKTYGIFMRPDDANASNDIAFDLYQKLGDQLGYAHALAQMGEVNIKQLVYDDAQRSVLRSMPIFKDFHDTVGIARCQALLAQIELAHGQCDNAMTLASQAIVEYKKTDDFNAQIDITTFIGMVNIYQNRLDLAQSNFSEAEMLLDIHQTKAGGSELYCGFGLLCECRGDFANAEKYYAKAQEIAHSAEYLEQVFIARMNMIKVNLFFAPGRWYQEEMLQIANESRTYGFKNAQLHALLLITWFEGVYGEQRAWEKLIGDLKLFVQVQRLPVHGLLRIFEFKVDIVRYLDVNVASALRRSAGWIRQCLTT